MSARTLTGGESSVVAAVPDVAVVVAAATDDCNMDQRGDCDPKGACCRCRCWWPRGGGGGGGISSSSPAISISIPPCSLCTATAMGVPEDVRSAPFLVGLLITVCCCPACTFSLSHALLSQVAEAGCDHSRSRAGRGGKNPSRARPSAAALVSSFDTAPVGGGGDTGTFGPGKSVQIVSKLSSSCSSVSGVVVDADGGKDIAADI